MTTLLDIQASFLPVVFLWGLLWLVTPWIRSNNTVLRRGVFLLFCVLQALYFWWRISTTFEAEGLQGVYAAVILFLEIVLLYPTYELMKQLQRTRSRSAEADAHAGWYLADGRPPRVDILIPTYNEAWPILEKTVVGALAQDYPNVRVWVCDDGRRQWLKEAVESIGGHYTTRSDNAHAKSGNLNAALARILADGEAPAFVAVLDADFVPRNRFVSRAMSLMHDPTVGIVQTPQYQYNEDLFQTAFKCPTWPDNQHFTFNVTLPAAEGWGYPFCCGTSFIARVAALESIGFLPTESITEDVLTTMKMRAKGYRTVYLCEPLSAGLAPEGLHEFLTQRGRWCLGGVQIAWWLIGPRGPRASLYRKIKGVEPFLRWGYCSLVYAVYMLIPLIYWFLGEVPYNGGAIELVVYSFPLLILQRSFVTWVSDGSRLPIITQASRLLESFAVVPAMLKGIFKPGNHRFVVTDKGATHAGVVIHGKPLRWLLSYALLLITGMIYSLAFAGPAPTVLGFTYVSVGWSAVNLAIVAVAIVPCIELPRRRGEQRFVADERIRIDRSTHAADAVLRDISLSGARIELDEILLPGDVVSLQLGPIGPISAEVRRRIGKRAYGLALRATDEQRRQLIRRIYCHDGYLTPRKAWGGVPVLRAVLRRLFV